MKYLLLIGLGAAYWAWRSAKLGKVSHGDVAAAIGAIVGLALFRKGEAAPALLAFAGVAAWAIWRSRHSEAAMDAAEARRLLDLPLYADAVEIRAAHRRLIARVHPDAGGSEHLARRINAARDTLIAEVNRAGPRAS